MKLEITVNGTPVVIAGGITAHNVQFPNIANSKPVFTRYRFTLAWEGRHLNFHYYLNSETKDPLTSVRPAIESYIRDCQAGQKSFTDFCEAENRLPYDAYAKKDWIECRELFKEWLETQPLFTLEELADVVLLPAVC